MSRSKEKSLVRSFLLGSGILIISNICIKAIGFFLMPLYTKYLTTDMLGVSDTITSFTGLIFPLLVFGLDSAFSAFYFDKQNSQQDKVYHTISVSLALIGIFLLIGVFWSRQLSILLFKTIAYSTPVSVALVSVSFNLWFLSYALFCRMQNKMLLFSMINVIASLAMIVLNVVFLVKFQLAELSLILSTAIAHLLQLILYMVFLKKIPKIRFFDCNLLKKMLTFSLPIVPSTLMMWILSLSDRYVLLYFIGTSAVGIYGIGGRFVLILNVVISAVATAYTTFAFASKEEKNAKRTYAKILHGEFLVLVLICLTVSVFSQEILAFMVDSTYQSGYTIIRDLVFAQAVYGLSTVVSYGIYFEKKSAYALISTTVGALSNIGLNIILIPIYGINAAALTTLICYVIVFVLNYLFAQKLYPCAYHLKKIVLVFVIAYCFSWILLEQSLLIKSIGWIFVVTIILIMYRFTVMQLFAYIYKTINSQFQKDNIK